MYDDAVYAERRLSARCRTRYRSAMNCSAKVGTNRIALRHRPIPLGLCVVVLGLAASGGAQAQGRAELDDAAARAQYAFLTSDTRALEEVRDEVLQMSLQENLQTLKSYQLAYTHWKTAQLSARRGSVARASASKAAKACVDQAKRAVKQDGRFAEAYAVQAICEDKPFALEHSADGECERNRALRTAVALAPKKPRVKFIPALCAGPGQGDAPLARWREVVASFDDAPKPESAVDDWGHAEALTLLAQALLAQGQQVAARDAVERALVMAPDYDVAQRVQKSISEQH